MDRYAIQTLSMAPSGSYIVVDHDAQDITIHVSHPQYIPTDAPNEFQIRKDASTGELYLYAELIRFDGGPPGLGAVACLRCAQMCRTLGFSRIDLVAAGGKSYKIQPQIWNPGFNGYYTWGRFGFNAELHPTTIANLQKHPHLRGCTDLLDLVERDAQWWRDEGAGCDMSFDLREDSRSWQTLTRYLSQKGYRK